MEKIYSTSQEITLGNEAGGYKIRVEVRCISPNEATEIKYLIEQDFKVIMEKIF